MPSGPNNGQPTAAAALCPQLPVLQRALSQVAHCLPYGIACVNQRLEILFMNREGRGLLRQNDGLASVSNRLVIENSQKAAELQQILKSFHSLPQARYGTVLVPRPSMRRSFELILTGSDAREQQEPANTFVLFIFDHDKPTQADDEMISRLYGLTNAESRVVVLLMQGRTLDEISRSLHKARETVRKQLQSIFSKTSTNRQSELLKLMLTGPAVLERAETRGI
jgi:DNA-binding CsgD family transcriptional regulator